MGSWGPGVAENDHAQDLLSIETNRWASELRSVLDDKNTVWDDIEGHLIAVARTNDAPPKKKFRRRKLR